MVVFTVLLFTAAIGFSLICYLMWLLFGKNKQLFFIALTGVLILGTAFIVFFLRPLYHHTIDGDHPTSVKEFTGKAEVQEPERIKLTLEIDWHELGESDVYYDMVIVRYPEKSMTLERATRPFSKAPVFEEADDSGPVENQDRLRSVILDNSERYDFLSYVRDIDDNDIDIDTLGEAYFAIEPDEITDLSTTEELYFYTEEGKGGRIYQQKFHIYYLFSLDEREENPLVREEVLRVTP